MRTCHTLGAFVLLAGLSIPPRATAQPVEALPGPALKLGKLADIKLTRPPADEAVGRRVKALVADLAKLDGAQVGLSATLGGDDFAPVSGQSRVGVLLLTDHRMKPSPVLRELVALGPDALPHLLAALDDKTPTKITIRHDGRFGAMFHEGELSTNPVNPAEAAVSRARAAAPPPLTGEQFVRSYVVTVGDVCFVGVGQIVGRGYAAVRYQPTACTVISSPTHDAKLRADVRRMWGGADPVRTLFDSLRADYATEGVFNGRSLDGWYAGSDLQCGAAMRLLYYFPRDSAPLVAGRLDKLDVGRSPDADADMRRWVANGVRPDHFVRAVAWSREPAVRAVVTAVFRRAEGVDTLRAALPAVDDTDLIRGRLEPLVEKLQAEELGPYGDGYHLLTALADRTPDTAKAVFQRYLRGAGLQRHRTVCLVLAGVRVPWDAEVLGPLLADTREGTGSYAVDPGKAEPRLPTRVCDEAAATLARAHPELTFRLAGSHSTLDVQIARIREQLRRRE